MAFSIRNIFGRKKEEPQAEPTPSLYQRLEQGDSTGAIHPGYQSMGSLPAERATRSGKEEDAYLLGEKMGAQTMIRMQGGDPGDEIAEPYEQFPGGRMGRITAQDIAQAVQVMLRYRDGKASIEERVVKNQQWWKLRNWDIIQMERGTKGQQKVKSNTAWLWNCIVGKHADFMDCYPEPIFLPREESDKQEAQTLTDVIPMILQMNNFEDTYSACQWQKLQEGTAVYGVFWDKSKLNGLGDVSITKVNILNLFWEPGISNIEDSKNVFYVYLADDDELIDMYPQLEGKLGTQPMLTAEYLTDDYVPKDGKSVVIDWYYHRWENGRRVLHLCTFCNQEILFSTENAGMTEGLYDDGEYPFVLDPLYPVEGSPAGYGYIDVGKDTQTDIDTLSQAMVLNAVVNATPRHFVKKDGNVNEEEYADLSKHFVHVGGSSLGDDSIRPITGTQMSGYVMNMLQEKIDELKFVTSNTDVQNGGVPSGVTAASAIAALHEESGRSSKDSTKSSWRAYTKIMTKVQCRVRQGYDVARMFRITGKSGAEEKYIAFSNAGLKPQPLPNGMGLEGNMRLPVFDIEVRAQRENAYTKMSQNELMLQFYQLGFFGQNNADQALMCMSGMEFKGKEEIMQMIRKNQTLLDWFQKIAQIAIQYAGMMDPAMAQQIAGIVQGITGSQMALPNSAPGGNAIKPGMRQTDGLDNPEERNRETSQMTKARERSENATRPN